MAFGPFIGALLSDLGVGALARNSRWHWRLNICLAWRNGLWGALVDNPKAILGLRPEHLDITDKPMAGMTIPATVEIDEPMGADSLIWLVADGLQMSVRVPVERRIAPGTEVHLRVDMGKASLFDQASERRL